MKQRTFGDPVLELAMRLGDGPENVLDFAGVSDAEAEDMIADLDKAEASETAARIRDTLRQQGHLL